MSSAAVDAADSRAIEPTRHQRQLEAEPHDQPQHIAALRSDRHPHADLLRALR
jgi:hypothetical protein